MTNKPVFEGEILLCEDNSMNQELICARLAKLGLNVTTAENGKEGIEKVEYRIQNGIKPFALILMDIHMPVMDGLEAARKIRTLKFPKETPKQSAEQSEGVPIIALTANSTPVDREQYTAHGMPDCLSKPFTPQELMDCLKKYLIPVNIDIEYHSESSAESDHLRVAGRDPPLDTQDSDLWSEKNLKTKLVHNFIRKNKNLYNEITKAIDDGDIKLAHRLVHTLKSNAGLLDKTRLQKAAEDIESLLINGENHINKSAMNTLKTELDIVLEEFALIVNKFAAEEVSDCYKQSGAETNTGIAAFENKKVYALFDELETLLDGGDLYCLELINRSSGPNLRSIPGTDELIQQMEYFEFDTAKESLVQLKNNMSIKHGG